MDYAAEWGALPSSGDRRRGGAALQIPAEVQAQRNADEASIRQLEIMPNGGGMVPTESAVTPLAVDYAKQWDSLPAKAEPAKAVADTAQPKERSAALGTDTQNFMAGAGKGIVDLGRGAKQLLDIPAMWLERKMPGISEWTQSKGVPSAAQSAEQTNAEVTESRAIDKPLMETKAGLGGDIAGSIAGSMLPLGAAAKFSTTAKSLLNPQTYKAAATVGAGMGALQPVAEGGSRALNTAVGAGAGALGNAVVNTIGRVAQPVKNLASSAYQKAVSVLEDAGIPLDAAQKTGSAFLGRLRSGFSDNPFTAGAQKELNESQREGYNKAVLKTIGEDATHATSGVMGAAEKRINGVFKDILDRNSVTVNDATLSRIGAVQSAAFEGEKKPVVAVANRIIDAVREDGTIKGQLAYGIKKDLDRYAKSADSDLAHHARQLRSVLMDATNDSLGEVDRKAFSTARLQFGNMRKIEGAIDKEGTGNISAPRLANIMGQKANRGASIYGKGDQELVDLAYAGNMLLPDKFPNSGTAARLTSQLFFPVVGGMSGAHYGDSTGAGLGAAAGMIAGRSIPRAAQMAMQNPTIANYMAKGMQGNMTSIRDLLTLPETNAAVGGAMRRILLSNRYQRSRLTLALPAGHQAQAAALPAP